MRAGDEEDGDVRIVRETRLVNEMTGHGAERNTVVISTRALNG